MCAEQDRKYRGFILDRLRTQGIHPADSHPRFRESLELAFGEKEIFHQQPRMFYYPGLPQVQFYERDQFDWIPPVEAATGRIRAELRRVMQDPSRRSTSLPCPTLPDRHRWRCFSGVPTDCGALRVGNETRP